MSRRAFSLIEILVVVLVISLLLALFLPALRGARQSGLSVNCIANVRTCALTMGLYAQDHKSYFPLFGQRNFTNSFMNGSLWRNYYLQTIHWPIVLKDYLTDHVLEPVQLCPGGEEYHEAFRAGSYQEWLDMFPEDYSPTSEFRMSYGLISDARAWRIGGNAADPRNLHGIRFDEVTYSAHKGMLIEAVAFHLGFADTFEASIFAVAGRDKSYSTAFVDMHAGAVPFRDLRPHVRPQNISVVAPVVATLNGCRGRDVVSTGAARP